MATMNVHFVYEPTDPLAASVDMFADNLPEPGGDYTLPAATASALGGVKMAAVTATAKKTSADAAGEAPTADEYNALRAEVEEVKTVVNAVITSMRAAGQAASA